MRCVFPGCVFVLLGACRATTTTPPKTAPPLDSSDGKQSGDESDPDGKSPSDPSASDAPALAWADRTFSPRPGSSPEPGLAQAEEACGQGDASLHEVAEWLALHFDEHHGPASIDLANFHLRRTGSPYVMPRLWAAQMSPLDAALVAESVSKWGHPRPALGQYRCGVGQAQLADGSFGVIVLQVDVLADVEPLPTRVDPGTWVDLRAHLLVAANDAHVLLLPPEGPPRALRTRLENSVVSSRFPIDSPGTWMVQLMATVSGGPRPVAQMLIVADAKMPQAPDDRPVPGEDAMHEGQSDDDALFAAINAARRDQGLPTLKRNEKLDRVAHAHSHEMAEQGRISHDTGTGNPALRVERAGLSPKATGENVALAGTAVRLHRALWGSPSHRENMLLLRWDEVGVAVVSDGEGLLYATQLYVDSN